MLKAMGQFGFPVWMLILMCLLSLGYATWFAWRGGARRLRVVIALSAGLFFTTLAAVLMGLVASGRSLIKMTATGSMPVPDLIRFVVPGVSESFAGGVLGFATLTLVALIVATAFWRGIAVQ
jgi:hypothetical protein